MAKELLSETTIEAPGSKVFEILSDPNRLEKWLPKVHNVKPIGAKVGVGAERSLNLDVGGMQLLSRQTVTHHEPGKRFAWEHTQDTLDGKPFDFLEHLGADFQLAPKGNATLVKANMHFTPKGIKAKLMMPLVVNEVQKQMDKALANLKKLAEGA